MTKIYSDTYSISDLENNIQTLMMLAVKNKRLIRIVDKTKNTDGYFIDKRTFDKLEKLIEDVLDTRMLEERLLSADTEDIVSYESELA